MGELYPHDLEKLNTGEYRRIVKGDIKPQTRLLVKNTSIANNPYEIIINELSHNGTYINVTEKSMLTVCRDNVWYSLEDLQRMYLIVDTLD